MRRSRRLRRIRSSLPRPGVDGAQRNRAADFLPRAASSSTVAPVNLACRGQVAGRNHSLLSDSAIMVICERPGSGRVPRLSHTGTTARGGSDVPPILLWRRSEETAGSIKLPWHIDLTSVGRRTSEDAAHFPSRITRAPETVRFLRKAAPAFLRELSKEYKRETEPAPRRPDPSDGRTRVCRPHGSDTALCC